LCEIPQEGFGFCKTRKNIGGKLYTLEYGDISSISANPIEQKPFFHFYPGSRALTIGSWSCNFACPWCQNHDISKNSPLERRGYFLSPEKFIDQIKVYKCQGTSISFNEPTLSLEYSLDVFELAKREGFYNTYVTNGYMSERTLELLAEKGLDAMNIDIKGSEGAVREYCKADVEKVWRNAVLAKQTGIWLEITTLVIPGVNDDEGCLMGIAKRIFQELGQDIPWHVTRYYPAYQFATNVFVSETPIGSLEKAREIGQEEGLNFVYLGNFPGHPYENTYCPSCHELLIERYGFSITKYRVTKDTRCPGCHKEIPIKGEFRGRND
jgi:pyruvate formate lyase activating enzyme